MTRLWGSIGVVGVVAAMLVGGSLAPVGAAQPVLTWTPPATARWQYQLQGDVDTNICAKPYKQKTCVTPDVFDIDLYDSDGVVTNAAAVARIHANGKRAVCYVSAGSWENWRPDAGAFPASVKGASNGWPGERWLDVRATSVLIPIIDARVQKCVDAGFDAVEFDNVDGYTNSTGFPLSASDQLSYNRRLADVAHAHGLAVGLKNDVEQAAALRSDFDFAINEQCFRYDECEVYDAWTAHGQLVVEVEYSGNQKKYCADAAAHGRSAIKKSRSLKAKPWVPCA